MQQQPHRPRDPAARPAATPGVQAPQPTAEAERPLQHDPAASGRVQQRHGRGNNRRAPATSAARPAASSVPRYAAGQTETEGIGHAGSEEQLSDRDNTPRQDTTSLTPEAGLASAASLGPVPAAAALTGVGTAIDRTATEEGAALQAEIPQPEVGVDEPGDPTAAADRDTAETAVNRPATVATPAPRPTPEPAPLPTAPPAPTEGIATPSVQAGEGGKADPEDARRVQGAVRQLPTQDPGLDVQAGPPPTVRLSGDADPATAEAQKAELDATIAAQRAQGAADAAVPAGEHGIRVRRPREVIQPPVLAKPDEAGGGRGGVEATAGEGIAVIADEQQGAEVRAAAMQAQGAMTARRGEHQAKVEEEKSRSAQDMAALHEDNTAAQSVERQNAQAEVQQARSHWTAEQHQAVSATDQKVQKAMHQGQEQVTQARTQGDREAEQHITAGEREAGGHKVQAEADAARKKREAEEESDGIFGWLSSKVTAFFNALKRGLTAIFNAAKRLVRAAIDKAQRMAMAAIEAARKAIVSAIKAVGAALVALGDVLLAAFPGLRRRWRRFIENRVRRAEAAVNRLADQLKAGLTRLLDALTKGFAFLLNRFKKAMFAVFNAVKAVALGAIRVAKAVADALGTFAVLARDIAKGPLSWLGKLGASARDGVRNHLWGALKGAVQSWFDSKLEEVLGLGGMVWGVLKRGGIGVKEIGTMAFEGLKAAIPAALMNLLIEKIVAMIIPVVGAVMVIIQGLQAAWGAVQRILGAIGKFVAFLKAVKSGSAGPQFAEMVAAAAVVVIDFVSNWLIKRLRGPAGKIGSKVRGIADKIKARGKRAVRAPGKINRKSNAININFRKNQPKEQSKYQVEQAGVNIKSTQSKESARRIKSEKSFAAATKAVSHLLAKGVGKNWLRLRLAQIRITSGVTSISVKGRSVVARSSPEKIIAEFDDAVLGTILEPILVMAEKAYLRRYDQSRQIEDNQPIKKDEKNSLDMPIDNGIEQIQKLKSLRNMAQSSRNKGNSSRPQSHQINIKMIQGLSIWWRDHANLSMAFVKSSKFPAKYKKIIENGFMKNRSLNNLSKDESLYLSALGSIERARKDGMIPAMDLVVVLHNEGLIYDAEDIIAGKANPMAPQKSAVAAHRDDGYTDYTKRRSKDLLKIEQASNLRRESIGYIFKKINVLARADKSILTTPGKAAAEVAKAFHSWIEMQLAATPKDRQSLIAATKLLVEKIIVFIKSYRS